MQAEKSRSFITALLYAIIALCPITCSAPGPRPLPLPLLQVLRRLANEKMKLTDKKVNSRPAAKGLLDQILHGHNLRELFNQQQRAEGKGTVRV